MSLVPESGDPVSLVELIGLLRIERGGRESILTAQGRTDNAGFGFLEFDLPESLPMRGELQIRANAGSFIRTIDRPIYFSSSRRILVSTDKPIYQPGQTLRVRALAFDGDPQAVDNAPVEFSILDQESNPVFKARRETSAYGEAHTEWAIPQTAPLGSYRIRVELPDSAVQWSDTVRITRYELPNFTISTQLDRPYYLEGQDAQITVKADYLFDQPVSQAQVRIVREAERSWNYREQVWVTEEGEAVESQTDDSGTATATLVLDTDHEELKENRSSRFEDVEFSAYVTDPTTNRTEQRRFSIRVTKHAIHVYVVGSDDHSRSIPLEFYVSASYADGSPAVCDVAIWDEDATQRLQTVRTNRFGVAKVSGMVLPSQTSNSPRFSELQVRALDDAGRAGEWIESIYLRDDAVRVRTNKVIYSATDPIEVSIESSQASRPLFLNISRQDEVLFARTIELRDRKATVVVPNSRDFTTSSS